MYNEFYGLSVANLWYSHHVPAGFAYVITGKYNSYVLDNESPEITITRERGFTFKSAIPKGSIFLPDLMRITEIGELILELGQQSDRTAFERALLPPRRTHEFTEAIDRFRIQRRPVVTLPAL